MRAISSFSFEAGTSTFCCRAPMALRTRVRKSATGSVRLIVSPYSLRCPFVPADRETSGSELPTRLRDAGDLALEGQTAETQAADAELPQKCARTSAQLAAVVLAARELRLPRVFDSFCCRCHS